MWKEIFAKERPDLSRAEARDVLRPDARRPAARRSARWGRSIARTTSEIYLDTSFFRDLERRFRGCTRQGLPVRAGLCDRARGRPSRAEPARHPAARCSRRSAASGNRARSQPPAGAWSSCRPTASPASGRTTPRSNGKFIEPGDIEAALQTASAIGDDTLQRQAQGTVVPDRFTHGSAEQRQRWFMTGLRKARSKACNTFAAARL